MSTEYYVAGNLNHDGVAYKRHDHISLDEAAAAPLLAAGVIATEDPVDPVPPDNRDRVVEREKKGDEPVVGGEPTQTGEPTVDGTSESTSSGGEDITPEISEKMTREELEAEAAKAGVAAEDIEAAPNKGALVEMIQASRSGNGDDLSVPPNGDDLNGPANGTGDPSANL